jgi:hypothetical protein
MPKPTLEVIGVYRLVSPKMTPAQQRHTSEHIRRQLQNVVLIETLVENADDRFNCDDFTQQLEGLPRSSWQVAYRETILSPDGRRKCAERLGGKLVASFRVAFYLHYYRPDLPLLTSYGERNCPPVAAMPARLQKLNPFEPVD